MQGLERYKVLVVDAMKCYALFWDSVWGRLLHIKAAIDQVRKANPSIPNGATW